MLILYKSYRYVLHLKRVVNIRHHFFLNFIQQFHIYFLNVLELHKFTLCDGVCLFTYSFRWFSIVGAGATLDSGQREVFGSRYPCSSEGRWKRGTDIWLASRSFPDTAVNSIIFCSSLTCQCAAIFLQRTASRGLGSGFLHGRYVLSIIRADFLNFATF